MGLIFFFSIICTRCMLLLISPTVTDGLCDDMVTPQLSHRRADLVVPLYLSAQLNSSPRTSHHNVLRLKRSKN